MVLAVTFYNNVFNKTRHKEIIRDRRREKEKRVYHVMRGGNEEEGNQIFYIKGDSLFSNGYK